MAAQCTQLYIAVFNVMQRTDGSRHFAAFGVARCIWCREAWYLDGSLLGADLPDCMVCIYCLCHSLVGGGSCFDCCLFVCLSVCDQKPRKKLAPCGSRGC